MSAYDNLKARINYNGGKNQEERMNLDKLRSLKKALLYSYQAQTAILKDNREFRCLINHDKLKEDYDDKIISIPYRDICLNAGDRVGKTHEGEEDIGMKVGDTFTWKETNTRWIVIQEILEENAYFRGTIRKADEEITIDGNPYHVYFGSMKDEELWHTKSNISWNEMGYEVVMYITADDITRGYFHRFQKITVKDRLWEVQFVDDITSDTLLRVYLKETFTNEFSEVTNESDSYKAQQTAKAEAEKIEANPELADAAKIVGKNEVYPYDKVIYTIENADGGNWSLSNTKARIDKQTTGEVTITIITSKSGSVDLIYKRDNEDDIIKTITIKSF